jgi:hypothetical protein
MKGGAGRRDVRCAHRDDLVPRPLERPHHGPGARLVRQFGPLFADRDQPGTEVARGVVGRAPGELGVERPVLDRHERRDRALALHHQPQRHALDAPGGEPLTDLRPQDRAERVADEAIEHAPRLLRVHEVQVERARGGHGGPHRAARELVEDHAPRPATGQPGGDGEVPGDRLALAVGVGGQQDHVGLADGLAQRRHRLPLLGRDLVGRGEAAGDVHPEGAARQIAHMAQGGAHEVVRPEIRADGLRLGRRLDDEQRLRHAPPLRRDSPGAGHRSTWGGARPLGLHRRRCRGAGAAPHPSAGTAPPHRPIIENERSSRKAQRVASLALRPVRCVSLARAPGARHAPTVDRPTSHACHRTHQHTLSAAGVRAIIRALRLVRARRVPWHATVPLRGRVPRPPRLAELRRRDPGRGPPRARRRRLPHGDRLRHVRRPSRPRVRGRGVHPAGDAARRQRALAALHPGDAARLLSGRVAAPVRAGTVPAPRGVAWGRVVRPGPSPVAGSGEENVGARVGRAGGGGKHGR